MTIKTFKNAPKFAKLQHLAVAVQNESPEFIRAKLIQLQNDPAFSGKAWQLCFAKFEALLSDQKPRFSIFALGGNSKLPFVAFSTLPGVTCPGAGDCIDFCYSYRAWRFAAAFFRQLQNAYLLRFAPETIALAFKAIAEKRPEGFDFRLYVDGDFANVANVAFWMQLLKDTPIARAYGYSKSFAVLLAYDTVFGGNWPSNYQLNISSGHNASPAMVDYVRALPITRGEFRAVSVGRKVRGSDHGTPAINALLRAAVPEKIFPCPGTCGTCTGKGHACGMPELKGRVIAIAIH
jgi:hypothetical protein